MRFYRRLSFSILAPITAITLVVAVATIAFALHVTGRFADDHAYSNLRWRALMVRQIAEEHLQNMLPPGPNGGDTALRDSRVAALLSIEDFARTQGLEVIIDDELGHRRMQLGDWGIEPPDAMPVVDAVQHLDIADNPYDAYTVDFAPWRWRITVLQNDRAYNELATELTLGAWAAGAAVSVAAFAFMLFLTALVRRPIQAMIADLRAGQPPHYTGVAELEFLSNSIATMMADLGDKTAALERYRDQLELRVRERTQELTVANGKLQETNEELVRTHQQLLQSEKMASIGQLAAGVAHEINNPVGFVNSNLGTLYDYLRDLLRVLETYQRHEARLRNDPQAAQDIDNVCREVDLDYLKRDSLALLDESKEGLARVRKIVQDLRDFSHTSSGDWQPADLHKGIDTTLNIVWNEIKYKATVVKEYGQLPSVECLPSELNQVFMNLLVNAAHAIVDKGTITIRTTTAGDHVVIEVADDGKGVDPNHLPRLFEPFFTTKPVGQGTGLGLSLSYGIIRKHNGDITVESTPGQGARFRIRLPIQQTRAAVA